MVYYISCQRGGDAEREVEKSQKTFENPLTSDQKYDRISRSAKSDRMVLKDRSEIAREFEKT